MTAIGTHLLFAKEVHLNIPRILSSWAGLLPAHRLTVWQVWAILTPYGRSERMLLFHATLIALLRLSAPGTTWTSDPQVVPRTWGRARAAADSTRPPTFASSDYARGCCGVGHARTCPIANDEEVSYAHHRLCRLGCQSG